MYRHKYFNLFLHETKELEEFLQDKIVERKTLHEWPLSCVELLIAQSGKKQIYKSQYGPTVESDFYKNAKSELLVPGKTLRITELGHVNMLFEYIDGPMFEDIDLSNEVVIKLGKEILGEIEKIDGELICYQDISSEEKWLGLMENLQQRLQKLMSRGLFTEVNRDTIKIIDKQMFSTEVVAALSKNVGLVHNDLRGNNVFLIQNGYRVIDWQRPIIGPRELDLASLLEFKKIDPVRYVDIGIVLIMYLLRIQWFTEAAVRWFPEGTETYDKNILRLASLIRQSTEDL